MTKAVALIAFALCIFAIAGNVRGEIPKDAKFIKSDKFYTDPQFLFSVEGGVFCATCNGGNAGTNLKYLKGKVEEGLEGELEIKCKSRKNGAVTLIQPVQVDDGGFWSTNMEKAHDDDICTVSVVRSPDPQCNVIVPGFRGATINQSDFEVGYGGRKTFYVKDKFGYLDNKALANCRKVRTKSGKMIPAVATPFL